MAVSFSVKRKITFIFDECANWYDYPGVLAAYDFKNASDQSSSYINLANPGTYDLIPNVAPNWTSGQGLIFTGTQSLNTGIVPINTSTMFVKFNSASGDITTIMGVYTWNNNSYYFMRNRHYTWNRYYQYGLNNPLNLSGAQVNATLGMSGNNCYLNGALDGQATGTWNTETNPIFIGAANKNGSAAEFFIGTIESVWIGNQILDSTQVSNLTTSMDTLNYCNNTVAYFELFDGSILSNWDIGNGEFLEVIDS